MKSRLLLGACLFVPTVCLAAPEGSIDIGLTQGIEARSAVLVFANEGETISFCTSDNGFQDPDVTVDGEVFRLDDTPGLPNPVMASRAASAVIVWPPNAPRCGRANDAVCAFGTQCLTANGPFDQVGGRGFCGIAYSVNDALGYCNGTLAPDQRNNNELVAPATGDYQFNFVGEPETRTGSGESTRFFEIDVVDQPVGRVHSTFWQINAHLFAFFTDADFYAMATIGEGAKVFQIDFEDMGGFRYAVAANQLGIRDRPRLSACRYGDAQPGIGCLSDGEAFDAQINPQAVVPQFDVFLNYPDPAPPQPELPVISNVQFNDAAGTNTITPNGDGNQDTGTFTFDSNLAGTYEVIVDTNGDGEFDPALDRTFSGTVSEGSNSVVYDGLDADGMRPADGNYRFRVTVVTGETHFPMDDIEDNAAGFVINEIQLIAQPNNEDGEPQAPVRTVIPRRMYWNDTPIRGEADLVLDENGEPTDDAVSTAANGSSLIGERQRRRWRQPSREVNGVNIDLPQVYDTWVVGDQSASLVATCRACGGEEFDEITIGGEDEVGDADEDGLPDNIEDPNGDGIIQPGETDPNNPDTDNDGILDGVEDANQNGTFDEGETDPRNEDTDNDNINDGDEDRNHNGVVDDGETDPRTDDTDEDGIPDGVESNGSTNPLDDDTDDDGILDGVEDANRNGELDDGETNPALPDSDADGLNDGVEDANQNGIVDEGETDPRNADTDDDGAADGAEIEAETNPLIPDSDEDGLLDGVEIDGPTDPNNPDSDDDGILDGVEDANQNGQFDGGETNPVDNDTDDDLLLDGVEDADQDGVFEDGETDPRVPDTDQDGLTDGTEDANHNGVVDDGETDPRDFDTDDGGEGDGSEVAGDRDPFNPADDIANPVDTDMDGAPDHVEIVNNTDPNDPDSDDDGLLDGVEINGPTDPNNPDTDMDGLPDGIEDANQNGMFDDGETNPVERDTDMDGLDDGTEDANFDGVRDDDETDPTKQDTDDDGLNDGVEDANQNGATDDGETDPRIADTDQDGLPDGTEDINHNGMVDDGETNPLDPDTDDGGELDGSEVDGGRDPFNPEDDLAADSDNDGLPDDLERETGTNPNKADTDDDGIPDGIEDANRDGVFDADETDPRNPDTDGDGIPDGVEDRNQDGVRDADELDPRNRDSDGDDIPDGIEDANKNGQFDRVNADGELFETNGLDSDTDDDGLLDGQEDANRNGFVDNACNDRGCSGETDPRNPDTDADGVGDGKEIEDGTDPLDGLMPDVEEIPLDIGGSAIGDCSTAPGDSNGLPLAAFGLALLGLIRRRRQARLRPP